MTHNAQVALELMGPSARECLERAGGVQMRGVRFAVGQGKDAGKPIYERNRSLKKQTTSIVQRGDFLREFLAIIPEERMHASKKLVKYERAADGHLILHFADLTTHNCE